MSSLRLALKLSMESSSGQPPKEESGKRKRSSDGSNDKMLKREAVGHFDELNSVLKGKRKKRAKDASTLAAEGSHVEAEETADHCSASEDHQDPHHTSPLRPSLEDDRIPAAFLEASCEEGSSGNETNPVTQTVPYTEDGSIELAEGIPTEGEGESPLEMPEGIPATLEKDSGSQGAGKATSSWDSAAVQEEGISEANVGMVMSSAEAKCDEEGIVNATSEPPLAALEESSDPCLIRAYSDMETLGTSDELSTGTSDEPGGVGDLSAIDGTPAAQESHTDSEPSTIDKPGAADESSGSADRLDSTEESDRGATDRAEIIGGVETVDELVAVEEEGAVDVSDAAGEIGTDDAVDAPEQLGQPPATDEGQDTVIESSNVEVKARDEIDASQLKDPEGSAEKRQRTRSNSRLSRAEASSSPSGGREQEGALPSEVAEEGENEHDAAAEESDRVEGRRNKRPSRQPKRPDDSAPAAEEEAPRVSLRAAALVAKTKLMQRVASKDDATTTSNSGPSEKPKRSNSVAEVKTEVAAGKSEGSADPEEESKAQWVQCDKCEKWRKLPGHIDPDALPDVWECRLASWCPLYNLKSPFLIFLRTATPMSCETPAEDIAREEAAVTDLPETKSTKKLKSKASRSVSKLTVNEASRSVSKVVVNEVVKVTEKVDDDEHETNNKKRGRSTPALPEPPKVETLDWVECSACGKWRKVPPSIKVDSLPEIWTCAQNHWEPSFARCSVPQEEEEKPSPVEAVPLSTKRGRPQSTGADQATKKVTQWVQCERKNCGKWRKVIFISRR